MHLYHSDGGAMTFPAHTWSKSDQLFASISQAIIKNNLNVNTMTAKITKGLGEGTPGTVYATGFDVSINNSDLQPGTGYYYRTAATVKGETLRSGTAYFVTDK